MRRRTKLFATILVLGAIAVNGVALMHARAMCRFSNSGIRTEGPENVSMQRKLQILFTGINMPRPTNASTPLDSGLSFEERSIQGPNGVLEAWLIQADDPVATVVAFHGYSASKEQLLALAAPLSRLGCSTLLVDFYGSGGSSGSSTTIGYREAEDGVNPIPS